MFADFNITQFGVPNPSGNWSGSGNGVAVQNSAVFASPLLNDGVYCREFTANVTGGGAFRQQNCALIKNTAVNGAFAAVPANKTISVRSAIGFSVSDSNYPAFDRSAGLGVLIKAQSLSNGSAVVADAFPGYKLRVSHKPHANGTWSSTPSLWLSASRTDGTPGSMGSAGDVQCSGSYGTGTWYIIRLDCTQQADGSDLLTAYTAPITSNPGAETWTQVGQLSVPASASDVLQPWSDQTRQQGFYSMIDYSTSLTGTYNFFFDRFFASTVSH